MKAKRRFKKILFIISGILAALVLIILAYKLYIRITTPDEYMISTKNRFDYQKRYECSGYASAYVLRSLGVEADGLELYEQFTDKNQDGTLAPGHLWENLKKLGYKSRLLTGDIMDLKHAVSRGTPVIVLIKVDTNQPYLHYVAIVGYDEQYFYAADSLSYLVNEKEQEFYNRRIAIEDFRQLWKNDTFFADNIYITLGLK